MKLWHCGGESKTTQGDNVNRWSTANIWSMQVQVWIMYVQSEGEWSTAPRCAFDMHQWHTINIFGLGWRLLVPLPSIACDCNRWSPRFSQTPSPPPHPFKHTPTGDRLPLPPPSSLNNHQHFPKSPSSWLSKKDSLTLFNPHLALLSSPPTSSSGPLHHPYPSSYHSAPVRIPQRGDKAFA